MKPIEHKKEIPMQPPEKKYTATFSCAKCKKEYASFHSAEICCKEYVIIQNGANTINLLGCGIAVICFGFMQAVSTKEIFLYSISVIGYLSGLFLAIGVGYEKEKHYIETEKPIGWIYVRSKKGAKP